MLPSNGFYNKIISGHEGEHVNQWTAGQWSGLYDVDAIFALYDGLTFSSSDQFDRTSWKNNRGYEIFDTCTAYRILCDAYKTNTWHNREIDAHNYSNSITPNFLEPDFSVEYTNPQQPLAPPPLPVRTPRNP